MTVRRLVVLALLCAAAAHTPSPSPAAEAASGEGQARLVLSWQAKPAKGLPQSPDVALLCPKAQAPPTIDGRLEDPCWQHAARAGDFRVYGTPLKASQKTSVRVTYDGRHLYLAYTCDEAKMSEARAGTRAELREGENHDVWRNDCIELFLDPHLSRDECYQFEVDSLAQKWDAKIAMVWGKGKEQSTWDSHFRAAAVRQERSWTVEMAVPAASMGVDKILDGAVWGANFTRNEYPHKECSSWTPWQRGCNFHYARFFRTLILGQSKFRLGEVDLGARRHGRNRLWAQVTSRAKAAGTLALKLAVLSPSGKPRVFTRRLALERGATRKVALDYEVPERSGRTRLALSLVDLADRSVLAERKYEFAIPEPIVRLQLPSKTVFLKTKAAPAALKLNVGDVTRQQGAVAVELWRGSTCLRRHTQRAALGCENALKLNVAGLGEGRYVVRVRLLDASGKAMARTEQELNMIPDPFDW